MMDALISNLIARKGEYRTAVAICRDAKVPVAKHGAAAMVRAVSSILAARGFYLREKRGSYTQFCVIVDPEPRKVVLPAQRFAWTDESVESLRRMIGEGMSMAQIAKALGCSSRNAVIGKAHRLGITGGGAVTHAKQDKPQKPAKAPKAVPATPHGGGKRDLRPDRRPASPLKISRQIAPKPMVEIPAAIEAPAPVEHQPGNLKILDLGLHHCRWVIGDAAGPDTIYCGMPSTRGSYCACHAALAYRPREDRPKRAREAA